MPHNEDIYVRIQTRLRLIDRGLEEHGILHTPDHRLMTRFGSVFMPVDLLDRVKCYAFARVGERRQLIRDIISFAHAATSTNGHADAAGKVTVACVRCGGGLSGTPHICGFGRIMTGLTGTTFTRQYGPGEAYVCEPCMNDLITASRVLPINLSASDG